MNQYIIHPYLNKKFKLSSKKGEALLKQYIDYYNLRKQFGGSKKQELGIVKDFNYLTSKLNIEPEI